MGLGLTGLSSVAIHKTS